MQFGTTSKHLREKIDVTGAPRLCECLGRTLSQANIDRGGMRGKYLYDLYFLGLGRLPADIQVLSGTHCAGFTFTPFTYTTQ